jgi:hypothetical protein
MRIAHHATLAALILLAAATILITACGDENPLAPATENDEFDAWFDKSMEIIRQTGDVLPAEQATVSLGAESLVFWPYTGTSFDATPVDPINLVFAGEADPLQIRAALLALDGDRTAFGLPDLPPFNQTWLDAIGGDVQVTCAHEGEGWAGSVIQLTLGDYGPLRFHLRLFRTGNALGDGCWTLGGAHFELQIPGTTDHQVLSWEFAEDLVVIDLMRSGLLDPDVPMLDTGPINAAPSFRAIPAMIYDMVYDELPAALIDLLGWDPPNGSDVPLPSDGEGTILNLAAPATIVPEHYTATAVVTFDQLVPRPFCAEGPGDWLDVTGPVNFEIAVQVNANGHFSSRASYAGEIMAQPYDLSGGTPVPVGEPFIASVSGQQLGHLFPHRSRVTSIDTRLTHEADGPQRLVEHLVVPENGLKFYRAQERCIDE